MNILIVSFGNVNYDGRLREIIRMAQNIGRVTVISSGGEKDVCDMPGVEMHIFRGKMYAGFIHYCMKECAKLKNFDMLLVDNRKAIVPSAWIKKRLSVPYVVLDVRELYFRNEVKHFAGKWAVP